MTMGLSTSREEVRMRGTAVVIIGRRYLQRLWKVE